MPPRRRGWVRDRSRRPHRVPGVVLRLVSVRGFVARYSPGDRRQAGPPARGGGRDHPRPPPGAAPEGAGRAGGGARFRPFVLTSLTTFAGLAPLLPERTVSAQFLLPMASSLAFGVLVATAISLFLVPSLYLILEDLQRLLGREDARSAASLHPAQSAAAGS